MFLVKFSPLGANNTKSLIVLACIAQLLACDRKPSQANTAVKSPTQPATTPPQTAPTIYLANVLADEQGTQFSQECPAAKWRIKCAALLKCKSADDCKDAAKNPTAPPCDIKSSPGNPTRKSPATLNAFRKTSYDSDGYEWFAWSGIDFGISYRLILDIEIATPDPNCKPKNPTFCRAGTFILCRDGLTTRSKIDTLDFQLTEAILDLRKAGVVYKGISGINKTFEKLSNIYDDTAMCSEPDLKAPAGVWYAVRFQWPTVRAQCQ